jgi:hypothetical protein
MSASPTSTKAGTGSVTKARPDVHMLGVYGARYSVATSHMTRSGCSPKISQMLRPACGESSGVRQHWPMGLPRLQKASATSQSQRPRDVLEHCVLEPPNLSSISVSYLSLQVLAERRLRMLSFTPTQYPHRLCMTLDRQSKTARDSRTAWLHSTNAAEAVHSIRSPQWNQRKSAGA